MNFSCVFNFFNKIMSSHFYHATLFLIILKKNFDTIIFQIYKACSMIIGHYYQVNAPINFLFRRKLYTILLLVHEMFLKTHGPIVW